jgi:hypothetical protein
MLGSPRPSVYEPRRDRLFPAIRLRLLIAQSFPNAISPMENPQASDKQLHPKKGGNPRFSPARPREPEQRQRCRNGHHSPTHKAPRFARRVQLAPMAPVGEGCDRRISSAVAVKDVTAEIDEILHLAATVLLCFFQRIKEQAAADRPGVWVTAVARHLDAAFDVAQERGILSRLDNLHPTGGLATRVVESDFLQV